MCLECLSRGVGYECVCVWQRAHGERGSGTIREQGKGRTEERVREQGKRGTEEREKSLTEKQDRVSEQTEGLLSARAMLEPPHSCP